MFGLGFGEMVLLVIVAVVVIGPKDLPKVLRKLGMWSGQLRRWAFDLRAQSGIDEVLRTEGMESIGRDLTELRKLARGELDGALAGASLATSPPRLLPHAEPPHDPAADAAHAASAGHLHHGNYRIEVPREREWPREGPDAYGALPDGAAPYDAALPASPLAADPGYTCGIEAP